MTVKLYEVGESILDKCRGIKPKTWDVAVVAPDIKAMIAEIDSRTQGIVRHANGDPIIGKSMSVSALDMSGNFRRFYLCRKQGIYQGGAYEADTMSLGTIDDFLEQCPFTALAIAKDLDTNEVIDPYNGLADIDNDILRCTQRPQLICDKNPKVILQGIKLSITKRLFILDPSFRTILNSDPEDRWIEKILNLPSDDIASTFNACFEYDAAKTIHFIHTELFWMYHALFGKHSKFSLSVKK